MNMSFNKSITKPPNNKLKKALYLGALISGLFFSRPAFAQSSKIFEMEGFSTIKAEAGVHVIYTPSDTYKVKAEFGGGSEKTLRIKQWGDTLYIARRTENGWADGKMSVIVHVSGPELDFIEANSGAKITATNIDAERLKVRTASGGRVIASGRCGQLSSQADSGGAADLSQVLCKEVMAKAYSGGGLKVYASEALKTRTGSGGTIRVFGAPPSRNVEIKNGAYSGRTIFEAKD